MAYVSNNHQETQDYLPTNNLPIQEGGYYLRDFDTYQFGPQYFYGHPDKIVIERIVGYNRNLTSDELYFNNLDEIIEYFTVEETAIGKYDIEGDTISYEYNLPTGNVIHIYKFYDSDAFKEITEIMEENLESVPTKIDVTLIPTSTLPFVFEEGYEPRYAEPGETFPVAAIEEEERLLLNANRANGRANILHQQILHSDFNDLGVQELEEEDDEYDQFIDPSLVTHRQYPITERALYGLPSFKSWRM